MAGVAGIEPTLTVLETAVLPLNHTPIMVEGVGFEPTKHSATDLQSAPFGHFGTPP